MDNSTIFAEDFDHVDTDLSYNQYVGLVLSSMSGCLLSILGSSIILYCSRSKIRTNLYHRTLAILSVFDIFNSISWMLHPLVFNAKGTAGLYWANGNLHTCSAGGALAMGKNTIMRFASQLI